MRSVWTEAGLVKFIDQRFLPLELKLYEARDFKEVGYAIREMVVRGSPAIGAAAAFGMAQALEQGRDPKEVASHLRATRPTGHDLFFALDYMLEARRRGRDPAEAAEAYAKDSVERCRAIGQRGLALLRQGSRVLTHCNAGALATVDYGTALAPIRRAHEEGLAPFVYVDETRPRLQGSRLTAWELEQEGIAHAVIAGGAAGLLMLQGLVDLIMVGADRITASGDVANKVGTYEKAVLARENGLPFYVAAPVSTFDFDLHGWRDIPIEERAAEEVTEIAGVRVAPRGSPARNPAFDITPAKYVTGFVTEAGILKPAEVGRLKAEAARLEGA